MFKASNDEKLLLKNKALKSITWLVLNRIVNQVVITVASLVLVRLLFPQDFGTYAIIQFIISVAWVFADLGLARGLVQKHNQPNPTTLRTVWWTQMILGFGVTVILFFLGPYLIKFYSGILDQRAIYWIRILSISQLLTNLNLVGLGLLERELAYKKVMIGEFSDYLTTQVVTITLAIKGFGVESFVYGGLCGNIVSSAVYSYISPWKWGFSWNFKALKGLLGFGLPFQISTWLGIVNQAVLPIYVGRFPGPGNVTGTQAVGLISWAGGVSALVLVLSGIIEHALFPLMSRLQKKHDLAEKLFERSLRVVALTSFLGCAVIMALAPEIINIIYTPKWILGLKSLRIASLQMVLMSSTGLAMITLLAFGEARFYRNMHLLWLILQWVLTILFVLWLGFWGMNVAALIVSLTGVYALFSTKRYFKISLIDIYKIPFFAGLSSAIFMYITAQNFSITNIFELGLVVGAGTLLYFAIFYKFSKIQLIADYIVIKNLIMSYIKGDSVVIVD